MNKLISCIVPTHNQAEYLLQCLDSIFNQSYQNFELIIVNDASTDNTREILNKYRVDDKKISVIIEHHENKKLPEALNTGLKHCNGDYITWISSDSYYHKDAFKAMIKALEDNQKYGLVSTDFEIFGNKNKKIVYKKYGEYNLENMLTGNWVGCCFLFRKECFEKIGYFDPEMICVEDYDYWTRIAQYWPLLKIKGNYAYWRDHKDNMSNTIAQKDMFWFHQEAKLKEKYKNVKMEY